MLICEPKPIFCSRLMPCAHHGCFWNSWIAFICRKLLHAHFKTCLLGYKRLPSLNRLRYALCGMCWKFSNKPALGLQIILLIVPAFNNMSHWAKTLPLCPRLPPCVQVQPPMFPAYLFTYRCKLRRKITCGKYYKLSPAPVLTRANLLDHGKWRMRSQANMRIPRLEERMFRLEFVQIQENTRGWLDDAPQSRRQ